MKGGTGCRGFTLVELMIAMSLLALVMALLGTALSGSTRAVEAITAESGVLVQAETALAQLAEDLAGACPEPALPFQAGSSAVQRLGEDQSDTLVFAARHLPLEPEAGYRGPALIAYRVEREAGGSRRLKLLRADVPLLLGEAGDPEAVDRAFFVLAEGLRAVAFEPLNRQGGPWRFTAVAAAGQEGNAQVPAALRIRLSFWLDAEQRESRSYSTTVPLPVGLTPARQRRVPGQRP